MRYSAKTHIGLVRGNNEDACACEADLGLFVIADGVGGLARGEVASRMAADKLLAGIIARCTPAFGPVTTDPADILAQSINAAQAEVYGENADAPDRAPMGTTAIAVLFVEATAHYTYAGDSRFYLISRSGQIDQVTKDQTVAQRMIDRGEDPVRATETHGHVLTTFIGTHGLFQPAGGCREIAPGDTALLCTDGLSDMVSDTEIADIVARHADDPDAIAGALIARANENGGRDNITVIVIQPSS